MNHLKLVAKQTDEDMELNKLAKQDVYLQCNRCSWKWTAKLADCIHSICCPVCKGGLG